MPESTLWLISKKRYKEAVDLIMKAAKVNGKTVPAELLAYPNPNSNKSVTVLKIKILLLNEIVY